MLSRIGRWAHGWALRIDPWTNVYGAARTLLAVATGSTLVANHSTTFFRPVLGLPSAPYCDGLSSTSVYCLFPRDELELARWFAVAILALVASGWRPRLTGLLHWWVSWSFQASATTIDGGDQLTAVLTLLLLPVTLADNRRWHWQNSASEIPAGLRVCSRLLALSTLLVVRLQVSGVYFHAAVAKLGVEEWKNGTALYYWFTDPSFGAPPHLEALLAPALTNGITISLLTWGSILLEVTLFMALVMPRKAWSALLIPGIGFHAAIALIQGLPSFSLAMVAALVLYLRPPEKAFDLAGLPERLRVLFGSGILGGPVPPVPARTRL